jgi:hypothetical protein
MFRPLTAAAAAAVVLLAPAAAPAVVITSLEFRIKAPNQGNFVGSVWDSDATVGPDLNSNPDVKWGGQPHADKSGTYTASWDASTGTGVFTITVGSATSTMTYVNLDMIGYAPGSVVLQGRDNSTAANLAMGVTSGPSFDSSVDTSPFGPFPVAVGDLSNFSLSGTFAFTFSNRNNNPNENLRGQIFFNDFAPVAAVPEPATLTSLAVGVGLLGVRAARRRWCGI